MTTTTRATPFQILGLILCRAVVPLWVLTGAIFKLTEKTPKLLPGSIVDFGGETLRMDLYLLLAILIAVEFALAGVMFFLPRLARSAAIFTLSVFCVVLIVEMTRGAADCGCLGGASPPPWLMFIIDAALLLGVVVFAPPRAKQPEVVPMQNGIVTGIWVVATVAVTCFMILPEMRDNDYIIPVVDNGDDLPPPKTGPDGPVTADPPPDPDSRTTIPGLVMVKTDDWAGKTWSDIELFTYVRSLPDDLDTGRKYVIFFSRSCDHCQELLNAFFYAPPAQTIIVAVPESKAGFDVGNELPMQCADCIELEMPVGTEWFLTPPLVVALEDGVVRCAAEAVDAEVDQPECLLWH